MGEGGREKWRNWECLKSFLIDKERMKKEKRGREKERKGRKERGS